MQGLQFSANSMPCTARTGTTMKFEAYHCAAVLFRKKTKIHSQQTSLSCAFHQDCIALSGVPHVEKGGWYSMVHFVSNTKMEMPPTSCRVRHF
jgi:hypothetical protein